MVTGGLEPIPAIIGRGQGRYTLNKLPDTKRQTSVHTYGQFRAANSHNFRVFGLGESHRKPPDRLAVRQLRRSLIVLVKPKYYHKYYVVRVLLFSCEILRVKIIWSQLLFVTPTALLELGFLA